ncbi:DUF6087 family protein [Kitasatospora sp. MAA4]|uniref:DUF6087 family protein n=1 Tax=Kitasatospora sp. MAA4 TaxID=3035093 RepID=UPI002476D28F|nr:DUF6087 family protein [Kitasatospora sp. MAA4]
MAEWYTDRTGLPRPVGTRDAITLDPEARRAAGLFEDTARLVVEWDGIAWQAVGVAENYAGAYGLIVNAGPPPVFPQADTPVALLRRGTGRHRK